MAKSLSKTPAPKKDRITGSKRNPKGSAATKRNTIAFGPNLSKKVRSLLKEYNKANPRKKIMFSTAKAVVRRGMGAYSVSYRPTISGGRPNSRQAWGLARLQAFMRKKSGSPTANKVVPYRRIKKGYTQDNDLM
jgi:hypothetical protein